MISFLCSSTDLFENNIGYLQSTKRKPEARVFEPEMQIVQ